MDRRSDRRRIQHRRRDGQSSSTIKRWNETLPVGLRTGERSSETLVLRLDWWTRSRPIPFRRSTLVSISINQRQSLQCFFRTELFQIHGEHRAFHSGCSSVWSVRCWDVSNGGFVREDESSSSDSLSFRSRSKGKSHRRHSTHLESIV